MSVACHLLSSPRSNLYITYPNKLVVDLLMALFIIFWLIVSFGVSDDDTDSFFYWHGHGLNGCFIGSLR